MACGVEQIPTWLGTKDTNLRCAGDGPIKEVTR